VTADTVRRALGPAALLLLLAVGAGLFVRADLQRDVRLSSRSAAIQAGELPAPPQPRRPAGLDHRALTVGEGKTAREAEQQ